MAWNTDGSGIIQGINLNSPNWVSTDAQGYSACGWARPTTVDANFHPILAKVDATDTNKCMFIGVMGAGIPSVTSNTFGFLINGSNSVCSFTTSAISANTWYFFVATRIGTTNPDNVNLWVWQHGAGLLAMSRKGTTGGISSDASSKLYIGVDNGNASLSWKGDGHGIALWNCPMTFAEASALRWGAAPNTIRPRNLMMWAQLDAPTATTMVNRGFMGGSLKGQGSISYVKGVSVAPIVESTLRYSGYDPSLPFRKSTGNYQFLTPFVGPVGQSGVGGTKFRRSLSPIGTRMGSRQVHRV